MDKPKKRLAFAKFDVVGRTDDTTFHQGTSVQYHLQEIVGSLNAALALRVSD